MKVLNYGSMNVDNVYSVPHMVAPGETLLASARQLFCGGKGLNQSIAIAKAGGEAYHAGVAGRDGDMLLECLRRHGVDTHCVKRVDGPSAHTIIQVDEEGQNSIIVYADEAISFDGDEMDVILNDFAAGDVLVMQNELAGSPVMMRKAHDRGMTVVFNPSPINATIREYPLEHVDWFLLNEQEGAALTGVSEPMEILDAMRAKWPHAGVVLTLGADGAYCMQAGETIYQPAFPVKAVDTTAAGDTFTGYFVTGLTQGESLQTVMRRAARASSIAVSRKGAADSIPAKDEVQE